jgi:hypothetical protein
LGRAFGVIAGAILIAGCSYEWDDSAPAIRLTGEPAPLSSLQRISRTQAGTATLLQDLEGNPWAGFCEGWDQGTFGLRAGCTAYRVVPLRGGARESLVEGRTILVRRTGVYFREVIGSTGYFGFQRLGGVAQILAVGDDDALLRINDGGDDDSFLFWRLSPSTTRWALGRVDMSGRPSFTRTLPVPPGVDPANPAKTMQFVFTSDGRTLVARAPDGSTTAVSRDNSALDRDLGKQPNLLFVDSRGGTVIVGDEHGVRAVPLSGVHARWTLVAGDYDPSSLTLAHNALFYQQSGSLYMVPLDGSAPPRQLRADAARLLSLPPRFPDDARFVYSRDPASRYVNGAGDAWLGDARVMERGRLLRFSADATRLFFLEHAAQAATVGQLETVALPPPGHDGAGDPVVLGANVHQYSELPDGRVLAVENHALAGEWNRLVAIDPATQSARRVLDATHEYQLLPDGSEAIADVISGASGYDIYRVPIPPR